MGVAILVIDLQKEYFPGGNLELVNIQEIAAKARKLIDAGRDASIPIIHIRHIQPDPDSPIFNHETEFIEIHESVAPDRGGDSHHQTLSQQLSRFEIARCP